MPGQQVARADRRQQHLDDARGLLLDDAGRDPEAVAEQLAVEDQDREEREAALASRAGVDGLDGRDRAAAARASARCDLRRSDPGLAAAPGRGADLAVGGLEER